MSKQQTRIKRLKHQVAVLFPPPWPVADTPALPPPGEEPPGLLQYPCVRSLTAAQIRVLRAVAQTGDYAQAALVLECAIKTIENHLVRIHKCLDEPSTLRCVLIAERCGLLRGIA